MQTGNVSSQYLLFLRRPFNEVQMWTSILLLLGDWVMVEWMCEHATGTNRAREKDTFLAPPKPEKSSIYDVVVSKDCSTSTVSPHYPETIRPTFGFIMPMNASLGYPMTRKARSRWQTGRMHWWLDWCSLCDLPCRAEPCAECGMGITKWLCWLS